MFSGAEIRPHSQWNLGDFFPNFEKNPDLQKTFFLRLGFFFLKIGIFIQATHTDICNRLALNMTFDTLKCAY